MSDQPTFIVHIEADIELTVDEIWPEGDAPKHPTAEDVAERMERDELRNMTNKRQVLNDWCLLDDLMVWVEGDGLEGDTVSVRLWEWE
jgi:hypothetical protein